LDPELYTAENFQWAILTLDSRLIYVDYEAFLIPMLDFANFGENQKTYPTKLFRPKFNEEYITTEIKAENNFARGSQILVNPGQTGDQYLLHHGISIPNSKSNCYSLSLSFSDRQDDPLKDIRKEFFSSYFLFDQNHFDMMQECVSEKIPYSRRLFFYYYTLLMDETDLEKSDPKRSGLEEDKIVMETIKNAFQSALDIYPTKLEKDLERIQTEKDPQRKKYINLYS